MPTTDRTRQQDVPLHVRRAEANAKAAELREQWKAERRVKINAQLQQNKPIRATAQM